MSCDVARAAGVVAPVLALAVALGGCGGKDANGGAEGAGVEVRTVERVTTVEVVRGAGRDDSFVPHASTTATRPAS